MKKTAVQELQRKPKPELEKLLAESRERLAALKGDFVRGKVKNIREIREAKKQVARIETFLRGVIANNANAGK